MSHYMSQQKLPPISMSVTVVGGYQEWKMWPVADDFAFASRRLRKARVGKRPQFRVEKVPVRLDAWEIRERFLDIRNQDDALRFLNDTGPFYSLSRITGRKMGKAELLLSDIRLCQEMIRDNLVTRGGTKRYPKEWGTHETTEHLQFTIAHGPHGPTAIMRPENGLAAIWTSVLMDEAAGSEFRRCQREDCRNVFRRETRHDKKYCSFDCGHLVAVRKNRAANKAGRKHGKRA